MLGAFNNVVGTSFFPRYLEPFAPERIVEVGPGPKRLLSDPDVEDAQASVVKIRGTNQCGRGVEGSGFVYADDRVMTNAHVVAGVDDPEVVIDDSSVSAEVVYYNPDLDVAVLTADTSGLPSLPFDQEAAEAEDGVAILGYPQDGPYDVQPGRIRSEQRLRSPNIYGEGTVLREVFSLRGLVRPGNSGGPIVTSEGEVAGVVFAASVTDNDTGYALTAEQVGRSAAIGVDQRRRGVDRGLRQLAGQLLPRSAFGISLPWRIAASGARDLLDLADADEHQQRGDQQVEREHDQERPVQREAVAVPVDQVGDRHREHDDREHGDERGRGEQADPDAAGLDADLDLGLDELDLLGDQGRDVALGVGDQTADGRVALGGGGVP